MRRTSGSVLFASSIVNFVRMRELCARSMPRSSLRECRLLRSSFLEPALAPRLRGLVAANFVFTFRDEAGHFHGPPVSVDRYEGEIAGVRVAPHAGLEILRF